MIVCPEPLAAVAGRDTFARGGNAADAAIAAAFAQAVTDPLMCGLGGTGHLTHYDARSGQTALLDFEAEAGSVPVPESWAGEYEGRAETVGRYILRSEANQIGYQAIMIPGFVAGCWEAFQRFGSGRVSWADLLAPAIRLARDGFEVNPYAAAFWQSEGARPGYPSLLDKLHRTPDARRIYLKGDGSVYEEGDRIVQPDLARTLQRLADAGGRDFYQGHVGRAIAQDLARHGGFITAEDLAGYHVREESMFHGSYRGLPLVSSPEIIEMLHILQHFDTLAKLGHNSPTYVDILARCQRAAFLDYVQLRGTALDREKPLTHRMVEPERAAAWARRVKGGDRIEVSGGAVNSGTTHVSCVDMERKVVGINHSIGSPAGSGVVSPSLGFLYNNFLGHFCPVPGQPDSIRPGARLGDIVATTVFKDGQPYLAIGSPGGSRLITAIVQCIVNVVDHGYDIRTAVTLPRFHSEEGQLVFLEPQFPEKTAEALRALGNKVKRSSYMGRVQAILIRPDNDELEAGADPRGGAGVGLYPLRD
jgi:gamma-glutamyltranspeptidase/glutathione hydrolase